MAKNNINAYMWAELGVIYTKDNEKYAKTIKFHNEIASNMTTQDILEGRRRTKDWQPSMPLPPEEKPDMSPDGGAEDEEMPVGEEI